VDNNYLDLGMNESGPLAGLPPAIAVSPARRGGWLR
jgi:hypothetical protein